jgi:hypothetical protein
MKPEWRGLVGEKSDWIMVGLGGCPSATSFLSTLIEIAQC